MLSVSHITINNPEHSCRWERARFADSINCDLASSQRSQTPPRSLPTTRQESFARLGDQLYFTHIPLRVGGLMICKPLTLTWLRFLPWSSRIFDFNSIDHCTSWFLPLSWLVCIAYTHWWQSSQLIIDGRLALLCYRPASQRSHQRLCAPQGNPTVCTTEQSPRTHAYIRHQDPTSLVHVYICLMF
jgi:hypothetical protein